jgi:hypothetical protein
MKDLPQYAISKMWHILYPYHTSQVIILLYALNILPKTQQELLSLVLGIITNRVLNMQVHLANSWQADFWPKFK